MEKDYFAQLAEEIQSFDRRREHYRKQAVERAKERANWYAEARGGTAPKVMRRNISRRVRLYPWTAVDLDEVAQLRCTDTSTLSAMVLDAIMTLWKKYPYDEYLYLRRVALPDDSESAIGVSAQPQAYLVNLGVEEGFVTRTFAKAVLQLLHQGVPGDVIAGHVVDIAENYQRTEKP